MTTSEESTKAVTGLRGKTARHRKSGKLYTFYRDEAGPVWADVVSLRDGKRFGPVRTMRFDGLEVLP